MTFEIPIRPGMPLFDLRAELDGQTYRLVFDWNGRNERYYLTIYTDDGTLALAGVKMIANWPLLRKYPYENLPPGELVLADLTESGEQARIENIGEAFRLWYYPQAAMQKPKSSLKRSNRKRSPA